MSDVRKLIIIGSGPAGLTAAIYAARAEISPLVIAGVSYGGQLMTTTEVGNYPGFPEDVKGPELIQRMIDQAKRFGAEFLFKDVTKVDFSQSPLKVFADGQEYSAETAIIATGASAKWLGLPSEERLRGKGVSSCATCDAFFFKGKKVAVIGGGDVALEDAHFLTKFASEVLIIHRRDTLRASKIMQRRAETNNKIKFLWNTEVQEVLGSERVEGIRLKNNQTGEEQTIPVEGVFVAIGHKPNTDFLIGSGIELDEKGYIKIYDHNRTNLPSVFVAGDVHDHEYRQAVTAAAAGARAAIDVERWLVEKHHEKIEQT